MSMDFVMYKAPATAATAVIFILESRCAVKTYLHAQSSQYIIISSFFFVILELDKYFSGLSECMRRRLLRNVIKMHRERDKKSDTGTQLCSFQLLYT